MTTAEILRAAADLIEPEGAWTQGHYAYTAKGTAVPGYNRWAIKWCVLGAIAKSTSSTGQQLAARTMLGRVVDYTPVYEWNDDPRRTQDEVVAKLREAADLAERGEA